MIRIRITQDDRREPGPRAVLVAYRADDAMAADDPRIPSFLRADDEPDAITGAAPDVEEGEADPEADTAAPAESAATPPGDGLSNTWAGMVTLSVEQALPGFRGLPFAYEFIQPGSANTAARRSEVPDPLLRIVAAPGVSVQLWPPRAGQPIVRVDVIRVADPHAVPALGDTINASLLLAGNDVGLHRYAIGMTGMLYATMHSTRFVVPDDESSAQAETERLGQYARDPGRIAVLRQRDGLLFFDNRAERMLQVTVPRFSGLDTRGPSDSQARFGYSINPLAGPDEVAVTVAATANVQVVQFHYGSFEAGTSLAPDLIDSQRAMRPFALMRVPNFADVPWPGAPVEPPRAAEDRLTMRDTGERFIPWQNEPIALVEPPPSLADIAGHIVADVLLSRIPVVGDALDLIELGVALASGRDRWGQPVGFVDLTMMALGAALPFVNRRDMQLALFVGQASLGSASLVGALSTEDSAADEGVGP